MKKLLINSFIGVSLLVLHGCASIGSPEGGERDMVAPKLISTLPKTGQTNVKPEKIVLTFDEPIQAQNLNRQLIIAPYSENTYKTKIKDRTIELTFDHPWDDNTTYSLNFRNSIADITEKNAAKNVVVTFSTGNYLDSGRVAGTVTQLYSADIPKEASVLLYKASDTAQIQIGRPLYVTQSDSTGNFLFQNVKEGNYYIYALTETNGNLKYDSEKEAIAFTPDSISVNPTVESITLVLHTQDKTKPIAITRKSFLNTYEVSYNEGLAGIKIKAVTPEPDVQVKWLLTNAGKTLRLFPSKPEESSWIVTAQDSAGNAKTDTLKIRLAGNTAPLQNKSFTLLSGNTMKPGAPIKLGFEVPTKIADPVGAVTFLLDSTTTISTTDTSQFTLNTNQTELTLKVPLEAKEQIIITMDTTKIVPFIGTPYSKQSQTIQLTNKTSTGSLKVNFLTDEKSFQVQLLRDKEIVREIRNQKTISWTELPPGTYRIRVLIDSNENGKWDNGNLETRTLPEPVYLYPNPFEIRSDWEIIEENPIQF